jgi:hypothetical protein
MAFQERYKQIKPAFITHAKQLTTLLDGMNDTRPGDDTVRAIQALFSHLENELSSLEIAVSTVIHPEGPATPLALAFDAFDDDASGFQRAPAKGSLFGK